MVFLQLGSHRQSYVSDILVNQMPVERFAFRMY